VPRVAVIPCSMRVRHNEGPLCLQQARRQLGLDMIYNSMEVSVQRWVIDMLEIVRASERERARGVASLGLVPAKLSSSPGGYSKLQDLPSNRLKRIELSSVSLVLFTAAENA